MPDQEVLYDDGRVRLDQGGVTIRRYYFPTAASKRIPYGRIRAVQTWRLGPLTGRGRLWGSSDFRHWYPLDLQRASRDQALALDLGAWVTPVITPDDPDQVLAILRAHTAG